ncbi:type I restriction modification DNA specificity domain protein [Prevotella sp. ICM33]|jgi:putative type-1 restriction enzyme mjaXP specificity protein|uniref:restriction endonuclease subunit S n=1 Tax=Prevotella sp. ICM33 TaxID=1161412 RepID=UPI0004490852|nr:restriction endonuclease subunit S [Prevotella sp. ICM33]ETS95106.1 type I restriction modification DNA specificity domain protein [Prevotella sp. ICM33]
METTTYKISDIGEVVGGGTPSTANSDFWGGDIPWISPKDLTGYKSVYISHGESFLNKTGLKSGTKLLPKDTVLFSSRAPIGYVAIASNPICTNQGFKSIICNKEIINPLFLYYYIKGNLDYIKLFGTGATFPEISGAAMRKIKVQIPSLPTQQKIASILSAYDRLIENNTRRIRLLEQMAENLYKEWFVRFRFPEHENVEIVNGLPKGWEIKIIADFGRIETGKTPPMSNRDLYGGDILFVKTPDMHGKLFVRSTSETLSQEGNNYQRTKLLPINSIMVSCIGTAGIVSINTNLAHTNQQINSIILNNLEDLEWLYYVCRQLKPTIELFGATGATMTNLSKGKFEKLKIVVPKVDFRGAFHKRIRPYFKEIYALEQQNTFLTRQRDLLLPRLMSGKLEVKS